MSTLKKAWIAFCQWINVEEDEVIFPELREEFDQYYLGPSAPANWTCIRLLEKKGAPTRALLENDQNEDRIVLTAGSLQVGDKVRLRYRRALAEESCSLHDTFFEARRIGQRPNQNPTTSCHEVSRQSGV